MGVVIVDWRGRGGIARTTLAWAASAERHGAVPTVITSAGDELVGSHVIGVERGSKLRRFSTHLDLVRLAEEYVRRHAPRTVVLQNYVVPNEEQRVADAARAVGARLIMVPHVERPHPLTVGSSYGLRKLLRTATDLVAHSDHVADRLPRRPRQRVQVVPLPPPDLTTHVPGQELDGGIDLVARECGDAHRAIMISRARRYTGAARTIEHLAEQCPDGWCVVATGADAHAVGRGVAAVPTPSSRRDLYATVRASRALLVPQRLATQSPSVPLAHRLGVVPIVTDVGGLAQQVRDGDAGILLPRQASTSDWREALERLDDEVEFDQLRAAGFVAADADARAFDRAVGALVA